MNILIQTAVFFALIKSISFGVVTIKQKNIIGGIFVIIITILSFAMSTSFIL